LIELYPWLQASWRRTRGTPGREPHSLLISGTHGLGKNELARILAQGLLCQSPGEAGEPCNACKSCKLFHAGSHPDFLLTAPEEDSSIIAVDQVRALIDYFSLRPHTSARKVAVLTPAEAMNVNAANSLLKILEEPPADAILVLVSAAPQRLSATIRSRCVHIKVPAPATGEAIDWLGTTGIEADAAADLLAAANGAPLMAQKLNEQGYQQARKMMLDDLVALGKGRSDPVACAQRWKQLGASFSLDWLSGLIADLIQLHWIPANQAHLHNPSLRENLESMASTAHPQQLYVLLQKAIESSRLAETPLDDALLIEDILIGWCKTSV